MSGSDYPSGGSTPHPHHHPEHEGEYEDKDVGATRAEPPVGEYEDTDVVAPRPEVPEDEGSFADHDVISEHRHPAAEGSFEDAEIPGVEEEVEAVQVERAQERLIDVDDAHPSATEPGDRSAEHPADPH